MLLSFASNVKIIKVMVLPCLMAIAGIGISAESEQPHSDKSKPENKVISRDETRKTGVPRNGEAPVADDAFIRQQGSRWEFGTSKVKRAVAFEDGKLLLKSFESPVSGREFAPPDGLSEQFAFHTGASNRVSSASGGWTLAGSKETTLKQGERQLDITLERNGIRVVKSYLIYPGSSIIREWAAFKNIGQAPVQIVDPTFLGFAADIGNLPAIDFHWMTGGAFFTGSWKLVTESLDAAKPIMFDSYAPYPYDGIRGYEGAGGERFPGDGVNVKIFRNDAQVWPATGWQSAPNALAKVAVDVSTDVNIGDKLIFLVNISKNDRYDTTDFDPAITYSDGESHTASKEFSDKQGANGWRYQGCNGKGQFVDLVHNARVKQWQSDTGLFIGAGKQCPKDGLDAAQIWTAAKAGHVRITGSICNTGNTTSVGYDPKPGTANYAPWYALFNKQTNDGMFIGWDYFGHWNSCFRLDPGGAINVDLKVAGHKQTLAPGETLVTPQAFIGLFQDDLDNAGNECLDWQYRYLWDYTREEWFPAIRMLGDWAKGSGYQGDAAYAGPTLPWCGGGAEQASVFRKVFRVADLMRYCGGDVYHRDWGWWDCAGDWNGPDFKATGNYLRKYGMGQLIYAFLYTVDKKSRVAREHPDWLLGYTLDLSKPEVVEFIKGQLDAFVERWGDFEWRNDSFFTAPREGDDTPLLGQDQGMRQVIREFLDKHPQSAFQAVNAGGTYGGYDYVRYASAFSSSDGAVGILMNYYTSLLFPPDKTSIVPKKNFERYTKSNLRGLLCLNFDIDGDTWDPAKLEGMRELIDIYHYLQSKGVVGRWVKVYRPRVTGDDPTMYFQRLSRDGLRGIIIPKRRLKVPATITIKPKGLLRDEMYCVSFQESQASENRKGSDLMETGISFKQGMLPGELIYLNLPMHPGSKLDTEPPAAPGDIAKQTGENMGYPGVELRWQPGSDNNWVSYYEIFRNGLFLDKVAKGTFYLDHSAGADLAATYEVRTVDGAGNVSAKVAAKGPARKPAQVFDDAPGQGFTYKGEWKHQAGILPAHAGTLSCSNKRGAMAELVFEGKTVILFTKLGADCGKAAVSIDGAAPEVVDSYSADDIWGIGIYRKELATAGRHTLRIEVLGERFVHPTYRVKNPDTIFHIDGIRIE